MSDEKQEKAMSDTPTVDELKRLREAATPKSHSHGFAGGSCSICDATIKAQQEYREYAVDHSVTLCETLERDKRELVDMLDALADAMDEAQRRIAELEAEVQHYVEQEAGESI